MAVDFTPDVGLSPSQRDDTGAQPPPLSVDNAERRAREAGPARGAAVKSGRLPGCETFADSMRVLCADEVRLRELELVNPVEELVHAIVDTLAQLPERWPLLPVGSYL